MLIGDSPSCLFRIILNKKPGPVFCLLLGLSSDYAQPITGQVTEVTCPVIGQAPPELTRSKRQKTDPCLSSADKSWARVNVSWISTARNIFLALAKWPIFFSRPNAFFQNLYKMADIFKRPNAFLKPLLLFKFHRRSLNWKGSRIH